MQRPIPFGKYILLERISVGGMAEVFKAKSFGVQGFSRIIAIKKIRKVTLCPCRGNRCAAVVQLHDRSKIRIPADCLPPAATLARALRRRGIKVEIRR